jgi:hypothetical protein
MPSTGRQRKKSRFLKIFSKNPKVPPNAAVNDYMNGEIGRTGRSSFLKYFSKTLKFLQRPPLHR